MGWKISTNQRPLKIHTIWAGNFQPIRSQEIPYRMVHNYRPHSSYTPQKMLQKVFLGSFIQQINALSVL